MRALRFLAPGDDGDVVLECEDGSEQYRLIVDDKLLAAVQPDAPPAGSADDASRGAHLTPREEPVIDLAPRDIQMRVRAGEEPAAIAGEAGVPIERVMRFAHAVLAERLRVVDEARRSRTRDEHGNAVEFGPLVDQRIASLGVEPAAVSWDSLRRPDGGWTVTATFTARSWMDTDEALLARFSVALAHRTVSALNETASDLLTGEPLRQLAPPPAVVPQLDTDRVDPDLTAEESAPGAESAGSAEYADVVDGPFGQAEVRGPRSPLRLPSRRQKAHTHPLPVPLDDEMVGDLFDQEALDPVGDRTVTRLPFVDLVPFERAPLEDDAPLEDAGFGEAGFEEAPFGDAVRFDDLTLAEDAMPLSDVPPFQDDDVQFEDAVPLSDVSPFQDDDLQFEDAGQFEAGARRAGTERPSEEDRRFRDEPLPFDHAELEPPPASIRPEGAHSHAERNARRTRSSDKPRMPSWDDILFGVRRKSD